MGYLVKAFGLFLLSIWCIGGAVLLSEEKAHGEPMLVGALVLAPALLLAATLVGLGLQRLIPAWRRGTSRIPTAIALALAAISFVGTWVLIDTNVANQRPAAEVTAALAPVCAGTGVSSAGRLAESSSTPLTVPNHLVVLGPDGREIDWTGHPSATLRPPTLADAEIVACADATGRETQLEVCHYTNGPDVTRYADSRDVVVYAARTGGRLLSFTATDEARACGKTEQKDLTELHGNMEWAEVETRLWAFIEHGMDAAGWLTLGRPVALAPSLLDDVAFIVVNRGPATLTFTAAVAYPVSASTTTTTSVPVTDLAPGERRLVTASLPEFSEVSSIGTSAAAQEVLKGRTMSSAEAELRAGLHLTRPAAPVAAGTTSVAVTVRNDGPSGVAGGFTVVFTRAGLPVALGVGNLAAVPAGRTATVAVTLVGDATAADAVFVQVDWLDAVD